MDGKPELRHLCCLPLGDWYTVGLKLGIKDHDLEAAEKEHWGKTKDQIREMFRLWLQRDDKATYRKLIEVLLRRKEAQSAETLAKQIGVSLQGPPPNLPGPTIGLDNKPELAAIIDVSAVHWQTIGLYLGLQYDTLRIIEQDRKGDTNAMKICMLRTWLRQDGNASYRQLAKSLVASNQNDEAKRLVESLGHTLDEINQSAPPTPTEEHTCTPRGIDPSIPPRAAVNPQEVQVPSVIDKYLKFLKVCSEEHCLVSSDGGSTKMSAYKMTSPHGIALIISNLMFASGCRLPYRAGADVDETSLQELFSPKYLNYKVVLLKNLTGEQIDLALRLVSGHEGQTYTALLGPDMEALKALREEGNRISANHDSFVCCLLSHGKEGVVYGTDGNKFDLNNICNYLGPCKHLSGKPKMAFIQACQGENIAEQDSAKPPSVERSRLTTKTGDFLLSYSAFQGQKSFRWIEGKGTWYINALCRIFKENYKTMDVVSMIAEVHYEVSNEKFRTRRGEHCLQCPRLEHTLRCKVQLATVKKSDSWGWQMIEKRAVQGWLLGCLLWSLIILLISVAVQYYMSSWRPHVV